MTLNWLQVCSLISDSIAVVVNLSLLPLIIFYSGPLIGNYKYLLFLYASSAATYSLVQMISLPTYYVTDIGFLFYGTAPLFLRTGSNIALYSFLWFLMQIIIALNLAFIYRCCVVCFPHRLIWFHEKKHIYLVVLAALGIQSFVVGFTWLGGQPGEDCDIFMGPAFTNFTGKHIKDVGYAGAVIYNNGNIKYRFICVLCTWGTVMVTSTVNICYCMTKVVVTLSGNTGLSHITQQAQQRLFILLLLQSLFPLVFTFIPPFTAYALSILRIPSMNLTAFFGPSLCIAQAVDPFLTYYFIKDYRMALLSIVSCGRKAKIQPDQSTWFDPTTAVNTTHTTGAEIQQDL